MMICKCESCKMSKELHGIPTGYILLLEMYFPIHSDYFTFKVKKNNGEREFMAGVCCI